MDPRHAAGKAAPARFMTPASLDKSALESLYEQVKPACEASLQALQMQMRAFLEQHGFTPTVKYRVKRFPAYFAKLQRSRADQRALSSARLSDFLGLRIVSPFLSDIEVIERLVSAHFPVLEVERKGDQHSFREFGYDSVHLLVSHPLDSLDAGLPGIQPVCEIQLRTILQDAWAEVEHELVYKSDIDLPNESVRRKLASLNATLTLSDLIFQEIRDFQQELRERGRKRRESLLCYDENYGEAATAHRPQPAATELSSPMLRLGPVPATLTSDLEKLMLKALEVHSNHDFQTAIELYGKLLGMKLQKRLRALVYNHRGMAHFARGETRKALKDFARALQFEPDNIRSLCNRGLCHRILRQFDQALADFDQALRLDRDQAESYFARAQCYYEMGLCDQALDDCREVLQRDPDHHPARHLRKLIHRRML
ncbi:MAG: tetratricopeptide repeat protein [Desulfuromonadales bacterium]|nr:tetratricopeptide repeat protein [Desulfuromonadales bacterium]